MPKIREDLDFKTFSIRNRIRCESESGFNHKLNSWSSSDWLTAVVGELGEAANIIKKLNRVRDNIPGNKETEIELKDKLKYELADTFIYLDLLIQSLDLSIEDIIQEKFEITSEKIGYKG